MEKVKVQQNVHYLHFIYRFEYYSYCCTISLPGFLNLSYTNPIHPLQNEWWVLAATCKTMLAVVQSMCAPLMLRKPHASLSKVCGTWLYKNYQAPTRKYEARSMTHMYMYYCARWHQ